MPEQGLSNSKITGHLERTKTTHVDSTWNDASRRLWSDGVEANGWSCHECDGIRQRIGQEMEAIQGTRLEFLNVAWSHEGIKIMRCRQANQAAQKSCCAFADGLGLLMSL